LKLGYKEENKMERNLKIFKGQCLNLALETLKQENKRILENLDELFDRTEVIYKKGKEKKFPDTI